MRPRIGLDGATLRANLRAFAALGAPVAAVVKNDGYNWGAGRIAREIDAEVESYVVADEDEFWALRPFTRHAIRLLADAPPAHLPALLANGAVPNVSTRDGLAAADAWARASGRRPTIRIGIIDAAGWNGITVAEIAAFAAVAARADASIELWTHLSSEVRARRMEAELDAAVRLFSQAGAAVVGTDVASTATAAPERARDRLRVGIGLFGARLGAPVTTACAVRVLAPAVRWYPPGQVAWAGYGDTQVSVNRGVGVLRCGYGDGIPKMLVGTDDILSVGMQYTVRLSDEAVREHALIGAASDLDALAARAGTSPHELVVGLAQRR